MRRGWEEAKERKKEKDNQDNDSSHKSRKDSSLMANLVEVENEIVTLNLMTIFR